MDRFLRPLHAGLWATLVVALVSACGTPPAPTQSRAATLRDSPADWDDVDAAVYVAASKVEMAILERQDVGPDTAIYSLMTVRDEPVTLRIERKPPPSAGGGGVAMTCIVGRFGDRAREEALMGGVGQRLEDLHGKDYAPVR